MVLAGRDRNPPHLREAESLAAAVVRRIAIDANGTHTAEDAQRLRAAHAGLMADFFSLHCACRSGWSGDTDEPAAHSNGPAAHS